MADPLLGIWVTLPDRPKPDALCSDPAVVIGKQTRHHRSYVVGQTNAAVIAWPRSSSWIDFDFAHAAEASALSVVLATFHLK